MEKCPRCVNGQTYLDLDDHDRVCLQCGWRGTVAPEWMPPPIRKGSNMGPKRRQELVRVYALQEL